LCAINTRLSQADQIQVWTIDDRYVHVEWNKLNIELQMRFETE
jgi:hypothetical protein